MEIIFKGHQTDVPARFKEYAAAKLNRLEKLDQKAIRVDVELSVERNPRQASQKERVELTIMSRGPAIRAEASAEDRLAALDLALAKLNSRLRRALGRRKNHYGTGVGAATGASTGQSGGAGPGGRSGARTAATRASAADESATEQDDLAPASAEEDAAAQGDGIVPIKMEGDGPLVVRQKFHHAKPISIDQALLEMELVGHDFYLFHDIEADTPSVVYRRHGYHYGVIRLVENSQFPGPEPESSPAELGARIPSRRRAEQGAPVGRNSARGSRSAVLRPG
ncbi:MAG TPA: ribosome-associated translation inhibitor RaiA [Streptosporangiaceae bacterium]|nr:ribosome-associated translation inhibitor RaiA [Streptosporangiaceae bacterium]